MLSPKDITVEFITTCSLIEVDKNFRPGCTKEQLLDLVEVNGITRYIPRRDTMALTQSNDYCEFGRIYNFLTTYCINGSWDVCVRKLLVRYDSSVSFHNSDDLTFNNPLANLLLHKVLGNRCLFTEQGREGLTKNFALLH